MFLWHPCRTSWRSFGYRWKTTELQFWYPNGPVNTCHPLWSYHPSGFWTQKHMEKPKSAKLTPGRWSIGTLPHQCKTLARSSDSRSSRSKKRRSWGRQSHPPRVAMRTKPKMVMGRLYDIDWYWLILIDIDWYWLILVDIGWYCLILVDIVWYWLILIIYWYWLILVDICWYLLILIDIVWYCLILVDIDWHWLILIDIVW
jgi:hypothetical protein